MQDMEGSVEVFRLFNGGDVRGLFDDTDETLVAGGAGAIGTRVDIRDVVAYGAEPEIGFYVAHRLRERLGIIVTGTKNMKGQALCAFRAYSGELFQLVDQARHGFGKLGHL